MKGDEVLLQNTRGPPPLSERPTAIKTQSGERSQSRRRRNPLHRSNQTTSSSHPRTRDRHDHSRRKTKEFVCVQDLYKLVQKRVEEVRMLHHGKLRAIATDAFNSLVSKGLLEYEFSKKFTFRPSTVTPVIAIPFNTSANIRIRW